MNDHASEAAVALYWYDSSDQFKIEIILYVYEHGEKNIFNTLHDPVIDRI